jgi:AcrR family transcriptional regulator
MGYCDRVTENDNLVIQSSDADPRAERLLDAAAALLVRLGSRRVTIDDVAREAGVGKGTVYLHFRTKEALFVTVLLRENRSVLAGTIERMRADPAEVMPARLMSSVYRHLARNPVTRSLYLGQIEMFGKLAQEALSTLGDFIARRDAVLAEHLRLLSDAGLLRPGLDARTRHYLLSSVGTGFFLLDPATLTSAPADPDERADLLGYAIHSVLEVPEPAPTRDVADAVVAQYEPLIDHLDAEWRRRAL